MKRLLFLLLLIAVASCHTIRHTSVTTRDTVIKKHAFSIAYDTTVEIAGDTALAIINMNNLDWSDINGPTIDTVVNGNRIKARISLRRGMLHVSAEIADSALQVSGTASGLVRDTTIRERTVVTVAKEPSRFNWLWLVGGVAVLIAIYIVRSIIFR